MQLNTVPIELNIEEFYRKIIVEKPVNILLVDDDISSVTALTNLMEHEHTLRIASNGLDALNTFRIAHFDVVITDIRMPKMNGIDLLKSIREHSKSVHVIIITGYPSTENVKDAEAYGVSGFFTKPLDVERFMETLSSIAVNPHKNHLKGRTMKLMIVDDEMSILESLERALKPTGYECSTFQSSLKALEAYQQGGFDVVISDFMMPEMTGIELLKAIRAMDSEARVIILTGYADIENAIAAVNNGAYAFFRKPLNFQSFLNTLKKIEQEIEGKQQKEVDMQRVQEEYARLRKAFESLQEVVREIGGNPQESVR